MDKPLLSLGLFTTVLATLLLFVIIPSQHIAPMMSSVSPDFYPNIGTVMLLVGGIGMLISGIRSKRADINVENLFRSIRFCLLMTALLGITLAAFIVFNFLVGGIFLILATMWLFGERRLHVLGLVALISPVVIWLFIDVLLGRSLP